MTKTKTFEAGYFGLGVLQPNLDIEEVSGIAEKKLAFALTDARVNPYYSADRCRFGSNCFPNNFKSMEILKIGHNKDYRTVYAINDRLHKILGENSNVRDLTYYSYSFI